MGRLNYQLGNGISWLLGGSFSGPTVEIELIEDGVCDVVYSHRAGSNLLWCKNFILLLAFRIDPSFFANMVWPYKPFRVSFGIFD